MKHGTTVLVAKCDSLCPTPSSSSVLLCMPKTTFRWATYNLLCTSTSLLQEKIIGEDIFPLLFLRTFHLPHLLLCCGFLFMTFVF